jgi:peptidoglycan L-alanyl-D-glutamate endopeptidase CwlK
MFSFSEKSKKELSTCHKDLQMIFNEVIQVINISVLEGHRTLETQRKYFKEGKSKCDGVNNKSLHQSNPSMAVDVAPYPIDFSEKEKAKARFYFLAGIVFDTANKLLRENKIIHRIVWGGDWNSNIKFDDQSFDDLPHFELKSI